MTPSRALVAVAFGVALIAAGCSKPPETRFDIGVGQKPGTVIVPPHRAADLYPLSELVQRQFQSVWKEFDVSDRKSEVSRLNQMAGAYRMLVSFNTFRALDLAHYYSRLTLGAYDLGLMPALEAWGFEGPVPEQPLSEDERAALKEHIGADLIRFSEIGAIAILSPGTRIAPNGLEYAYGVDLALVEARRAGFPSALISWGSYTRALGFANGESNWAHAVRNPFGNAPLGFIRLPPNAGLAIIGLRDRTVTIGGRIYGGIIDPRTVKPAEGTALVAVRAPTCLMAHVLAHALIVLGHEQGPEILAEFPEADALLVRDVQPVELWATDGWLKDFTPSPGVPIPTHLPRK